MVGVWGGGMLVFWWNWFGRGFRKVGFEVRNFKFDYVLIVVVWWEIDESIGSVFGIYWVSVCFKKEFEEYVFNVLIEVLSLDLKGWMSVIVGIRWGCGFYCIFDFV